MGRGIQPPPLTALDRVLEQQFQTDNNGNPRTRILQVSGLEFSYN